jgi:hypothetical protein
MLAFALVFIIIITTLSNMLIPTSIVQVTDCSLTSSTVNSGGQTSITITLKSNDDKNSYLIRIEFTSYYLVKFLLGSNELPRNDGVWCYEETLNPKATHTQLILVRPTLESGISETKYRISVVFFINGTQFDNKNLDLTVRLP